VRIASSPVEGSINAAHAVVDTKMYLGDEVQVLATLDGGTQMVIREQRVGSDESHDAIRPGDQIMLQWDRTAPVLLAEAPARDPMQEPMQDPMQDPMQEPMQQPMQDED
jgi:ABC-type Fe3+/spermidine/putrescine transport system ATPase subunit